MPCKMCIERGQTWNGSVPHCGFDAGTFSRENWNCATINALRDIAGNTKQYDEDQYYAFVRCAEFGDFLYLSWYKNRGRTEHMWIVTYDEAPRLPTEQDCLKAIEQNKR